MKTLILCVDRDDDIGRKADLQTPLVGRRRLLDAATKLGCADPEDSDTNSLFAAVHLFDKEMQSSGHGRQLEVAAITGHRAVGLRADRKLAKELDEVLELTRADEIILVSDGAEDEQILPILTSRAKVAHVHRTIVRQAPRLEGFYYVLTRMMEDKKFARRYILPFGLVTLIWGAAFLMGWENYAWGITLGILGVWLVVHAMHWEDKLSKFFADLSEGLRSGKVSLAANVVALTLLIVGGIQSWARIPETMTDRIDMSLFFLREFVLYAVASLLVRTGGILFDEWIRDGKAQLRHWTMAFSVVAAGFITTAILEIFVAIRADAAVENILSFGILMNLFIGIGIAMSGFVLARYVKGFLADSPTGY